MFKVHTKAQRMYLYRYIEENIATYAKRFPTRRQNVNLAKRKISQQTLYKQLVARYRML